eukprot:SAG22_NODE_11790_length_469_cov_0.694595_2_plen_75_part_01
MRSLRFAYNCLSVCRLVCWTWQPLMARRMAFEAELFTNPKSYYADQAGWAGASWGGVSREQEEEEEEEEEACCLP